MKRRLLALTLSLSVFAGILAGCGGGGTDGEQSAAPDSTASADASGEDAAAADPGTEETPAAEGSAGVDPAVEILDNAVITSLSKEAEELDPTLNNYSRSSNVLQNLYRGLFVTNAENQTVTAYCKDYEIDASGMKYTFTLVDDAKWSDGSPLTAHDFEYSWKRVLNPEIASKTAYSNFVLKNGEKYFNGEATADEVGVKALDDVTLEVELESITPYFLSLLASTSYMPVKKEMVEQGDTWKKNAATMISNGPFMMQQISPNEKYVLAKNPNYYGADHVQIEQLVYMFVDSNEAQLAAYLSDEVMLAEDLTPNLMLDFVGTPELVKPPRMGVYYFDINCEKEPFNDVRVRRALSLAIDREALIANVLQWDYKPAYGLVPYGIPDTANPSAQYRDTVGPLFEYNVDEAKKLLEDAGYPGGINFPTIDFHTMATQRDADIAQAVQAMWKENLGIESSIVSNESAVHWAENDAGNFEVTRDGFTGDYPDPLTLLEQMTWDKQYRQSRWQSEEYEAMLQANRETTDEAQRMTNAKNAEQLLMDEMPVIPIYYYDSSFLVKENLKGVYRTMYGHIIYEYAFVQ